MTEININFTNSEITAFFAALTLILTPLSDLLTILVDFVKALIGLIPQLFLTLNSQASLNNSIVGSLISPMKKLLNALIMYITPDNCCKKEHHCRKDDDCERGESRKSHHRNHKKNK